MSHPVASSWSREGMDSIKAALLVLIVKERLRKERPGDETAPPKRPRQMTDALDPFTGLGRAVPRSHNAKDETDRNVIEQRDNVASPRHSAAALSLVAHDTVPQWHAHLQYVLHIIWRQPMGILSDRLRSLCRHVACQLLDATAVVHTATTTTTPCGEWLEAQWTSFAIPESVQSSQSNATANAWWATIWHTVLLSSPTAMSELMAPLLLDRVLHCGRRPPPHTTGRGSGSVLPRTASSHIHDTVRLEPIHAWHLLERALEQAPAHVLGSTEHVLLPTTVDAAPNTLSLVPARSRFWYSTLNLAHDVHLFHVQIRTAKAHTGDTTAGEYFSLGHGVESLSERLVATAIAPRSSRN